MNPSPSHNSHEIHRDSLLFGVASKMNLSEFLILLLKISAVSVFGVSGCVSSK